MSPLDRQLITRKTKLIQDDLSTLQNLGSISLGEYLESEPTQLQVERLLERVIGRMIDINFHILRQKHAQLPKDYFESFIAMAKAEEIDPDLAMQLAKSAGLRNILAHEYDAIDPEKVYSAISLVIKQVPQFLKNLERHLQ